MHFLHSPLLWGACAAAVPIAAHLLNPKSRTVVPFAPIAWLPQEAIVGAGKRQLSQLTLLMLRVLMMALLAVLCAHVVWPKQSSVAADAGPRHAIYVVDASASMNYRVDGRSLLERARADLYSHIKGASDNSALGLLVLGSQARQSIAPTLDRQMLRQAIAQDVPQKGAGSPDLAQGIMQAAAMLATAQQTKTISGPTEIIIFGDLARTSLPRGLPVVPESAPLPNIVWRDAAARTSAQDGALPALNNVAITAIAARPGRGIEVTVHNFSDEDVPGRWLTLAVSEEPSQRGLVSVPARGIVRKLFATPAHGKNGAPLQVEARLDSVTEREDGYAADDVCVETLDFAPPTRVLAVDGAPHSRLSASELFYAERALAEVPDHEAVINVTVVPRHGLLQALQTPSSAWEVVVLANVGHVTAAEAAALSLASAQGLGLVIALGDNIDLANDADATAYSSFMPFELRDLAHSPNGSSSGAAFGAMAQEHPLFADFGASAIASLRRARAQQYVYVAMGQAQGGRVLMAYDDGAPALLEAPKSHARGCIVLWTSSLDADWTDVPMMGVFVPLMQRLVRHAAPERRTPVAATGHDVVPQGLLESDFAAIAPHILAHHVAATEGALSAADHTDGTTSQAGARVVTWLALILWCIAVAEQLATAGAGRGPLKVARRVSSTGR